MQILEAERTCINSDLVHVIGDCENSNVVAIFEISYPLTDSSNSTAHLSKKEIIKNFNRDDHFQLKFSLAGKN